LVVLISALWLYFFLGSILMAIPLVLSLGVCRPLASYYTTS
jgi:hypothetical protein